MLNWVYNGIWNENRRYIALIYDVSSNVFLKERRE